MNASIVVRNVSGLASLAPVAQAAADYAKASRAPRTKDAYGRQFKAFATWCANHGLCPLPATAEAIALYLTAQAKEGLKVATLAQALAAISEAHKFCGHPSPRSFPMVRETWKGIRRKLGVAPRRVAPMLSHELRRMVASLPDTLRGLRDRALLTVGFAGAFRRSELVALRVEDVTFTDEGAVIAVRRSKTDQEGEGTSVGLPYGGDPLACPVRALRQWLEAAELKEGAMFRSVSRHGQLGGSLDGRDIARIVKRASKQAGLDSALYSGHSLRAGLATSAAKAGKGDRAIMNQGRWKSRTMVDRYVRDASLFRDNAAAGLL